jgi:hypothetical protein
MCDLFYHNPFRLIGVSWQSISAAYSQDPQKTLAAIARPFVDGSCELFAMFILFIFRSTMAFIHSWPPFFFDFATFALLRTSNKKICLKSCFTL